MTPFQRRVLNTTLAALAVFGSLYLLAHAKNAHAHDFVKPAPVVTSSIVFVDRTVEKKDAHHENMEKRRSFIKGGIVVGGALGISWYYDSKAAPELALKVEKAQ